jgi:hypothetical protein
MLAAFQALVRHTPVVRFGYIAATRALIAALGDAPRLHLVDVGIGSGAQWAYALDALARRPAPIERLRLTGIDLPAPGPDPAQRLRTVGDGLARRAAALGIPFAFEPVAIQAEDLTAGGIQRRPDEVLAVNAAFALHHVLPTEAGAPPGRDRDALLAYLRSLEPRLLTLVEPDLEHNALPLLPRVRESMRLYLAVFELLEALLPPGLPERTIIEEEFFGREIRNVTVGEGTRRVERHERRSAWERRLRRQGFAPIDMSGFAGGVARELRAPRPCAVQAAGGMLVLGWKDRSLIAASAWTPVGDRPS